MRSLHAIRKQCSTLSRILLDSTGCLFQVDNNLLTVQPVIPQIRHNHSQAKVKLDLSKFPVDKIRNFSIIAHVDHGKSTLADRLLEDTGTIIKTDTNKQVLDRLQVERERGITVKAQTVTLFYEYNGDTYLLNLIDTPGHVDFHYEVSRSLAACQGCILLVDANQGVQAQTVANFFLAFESELAIIPVLNKIDLKVAKPDEVIEQIKNLFDIPADEVLKISAKNGTGIDEVLQAIVQRIPAPPESTPDKPLKALLFDSWYDKYRGAIGNILVLDGMISKGDKIRTAHNKKTYEVHELGIMHPDQVSVPVLHTGQVGYIVANMKTASEAQVGDTIFHDSHPVEALEGFKPAKPMVYAGVFPADQSEHPSLRSAIEKLTLNDSSVSVHADSSAALGQGWRLGFLGLLHLDVFNQRLEQEYNASVIMTSPNVPYKVHITGAKNIKSLHTDELIILNPCQLPEQNMISELLEPLVLGTIIVPDEYIGNVIKLCLDRRGVQQDQSYIDNKRLMYKVILPLNEIIIDFFDELKSFSSGYASFDYEDYGYQPADLLKLNIKLNGKEVEELTTIVHRSKARTLAQSMCAKLKESIPRQLFEIAIQAVVGNKVIARENVKAYRKDVTAKCYGGDISRKTKLLKQQAEGKKRMRKIGNIEVPKDIFIEVLKRNQ